MRLSPWPPVAPWLALAEFAAGFLHWLLRGRVSHSVLAVQVGWMFVHVLFLAAILVVLRRSVCSLEKLLCSESTACSVSKSAACCCY